MIKIFETLEKYNTYTNNGQNLESGDLYYVKEDNSTHYLTNNIDGVTTIYDAVENPSGNIEITENGEDIDIAQYATATVDVPIPEGYILPTGNKSITANGENIDVYDYATATVAVPQPSGNVELTQNGTNIDIADYATATVAVPQPSGNINITANGTDIDIAQYATASVNVEAPEGYVVPVDSFSGTYVKVGDLVKKVNIPNGVTGINNSAFSNCSGLTSVTIPNSVTTLYADCFNRCSSLPSVTIPSGVTKINDSAFYMCDNLKSVTILATTPPTLGTSVFYSTHNDLVIYVPAESVETYKAASGWSSYASKIQAIPTT